MISSFKHTRSRALGVCVALLAVSSARGDSDEPGEARPVAAACRRCGRNRGRARPAVSCTRSGSGSQRRTACPTTTFLLLRSMATGCGSVRKGGWPASTRRPARYRAGTEEDGLPWRVVSAIDVHPGTGEVWIGMFGGGLARFSGGRFDHWHQLNSGVVNDVIYGVAVEHDNIWAATTAGAQPVQHGHRGMVNLHREERSDGGDLELRMLLRGRVGLSRHLGQWGAGI